MLGAAQPFISGAISKTCNLPEHANVKEIYDAYILGHKIGLKALAVFRNNSKPTSALSFGERGFVTIDNPKGAHPLIKSALSPLDFLGKSLLIHYKCRTELATEPEKVELNKLRGYTHGAFRAYEKRNINYWDVNQVLNDPKSGGFEKEDLKKNLILGKNGKNKNELKNSRGVTCSGCGNPMDQTAPNCYECKNCGDKLGGCGI